MLAVVPRCKIQCDDTDHIWVYTVIYRNILYEEYVNTVGRVGVGEPSPHSPHQALVTRPKTNNVVVKYIGRQDWVEGALTDSRAYHNTTTATLHYFVHDLSGLRKKESHTTRDYYTSMFLHE